MHGMPGAGADTPEASHMIMTFFSSTTTPLYSLGWTPSSTGSYAGTCIFLIILAVVFRILLAAKALMEEKWLDEEVNRRYVAVAGRGLMADRIRNGDVEGDAKSLVISENGVEEEVVIVKKRGLVVKPWRWSVDAARAGMDVTIVGVGYLLMLAVMTMNVGYFMSALGGTFLGSLALGRYTTGVAAH